MCSEFSYQRPMSNKKGLKLKTGPGAHNDLNFTECRYANLQYICVTFSLDAVLISGGGDKKNTGPSRNVELMSLVTKKRCILPALPRAKYLHTSVDGVLCAGGETGVTQTTCVSLDPKK